MSNLKTICLDAGHYGKYNRSPVNPNYYESEVVWNITQFLAHKLEKAGFRVIKTRTDPNKDMGLSARGKASKGCDLFLSIHTNACGTESVDRSEAWVFSPDNTTNIDEISVAVGERLAKACKEVLGVSTYKVGKKQSEKDHNGDGILNDEWYGVLSGAKIVGTPGVIIEIGFHTNKRTADFLLIPSNQELVADRMCKELLEYFGLGAKEEEVKLVTSIQSTPTSPTKEEDEGKITQSEVNSMLTSQYPKTVRILNSNTPVFKGVEFNSGIVLTVNKGEIYTLVEEIAGLGKLKSGVGYLRLKDVEDYKSTLGKNPYRIPNRDLDFGCKGEDVKWVKFELLRYGLGEFHHDNENYFNGTKQAVKKYQSYMGLSVTGVVDKKTRESLQNDGF